MSAQNTKEAADHFVALLRLEPAAPKEKKRFQLVTFASEEDCRFFYPRRALPWQLQFNTYISRSLRERFRIRVQRIAIAPADYHTWRRDRPDTPELRREFADSQLHLL